MSLTADAGVSSGREASENNELWSRLETWAYSILFATAGRASCGSNVQLMFSLNIGRYSVPRLGDNLTGIAEEKEIRAFLSGFFNA